MTFVAFQIVRASQLNTEINAFAPAIARRTFDFAIISNTLTNDTQLFIAGLVASKVYRLDSLISMKGSTAGDFQIGWTCSGSGSSMVWGQNGMGTGAADQSGSEFHNQLNLGDTGNYGTFSATTSPQKATPGGFLFTGTGSNITLQMKWCQAGVDGTNGSTIITGSTICLTPVG